MEDDRAHDLTAAYALDALDPEEREGFEAHLAQCERCRDEVAELSAAASALAFGLAHGVWGAFRGSLSTAIGATIATGLLGGALAVVFVVSHRVLAPVVTAHFLINVFAEPGLVLAAVRGEMSR